MPLGRGNASIDRLRMEQLPDIVPFRRRLEELAAQMASPSFYASSRRAADVTREHQKLQKLAEDYDRLPETVHLYARSVGVNLVEWWRNYWLT